MNKIMLLTLFAAFLFHGQLAAAQAHPPTTKASACDADIQKAITAVDAGGPWHRQVDPEPGATSYRSPTGKFATWVELHRLQDGSARLYVITPKELKTTSWSKSACAKTEKSEPGLAVIKKSDSVGKRFFLDDDFKRLVDSKKPGLVYTWSPGMVYSMKSYQDFKKVAAKLKMNFTAVMDPEPTQAQVKELAGYYSMPLEDRRIASVEVTMREANLHYPSTLVYANGAIGPERINGVYTPDLLEKEIKKQLAVLELK